MQQIQWNLLWFTSQTFQALTDLYHIVVLLKFIPSLIIYPITDICYILGSDMHFWRPFKNWFYQETTGFRIICFRLFGVSGGFISLRFALFQSCGFSGKSLHVTSGFSLPVPCWKKPHSISMLQMKSVCPVRNLPPSLLECRYATQILLRALIL